MTMAFCFVIELFLTEGSHWTFRIHAILTFNIPIIFGSVKYSLFLDLTLQIVYDWLKLWLYFLFFCIFMSFWYLKLLLFFSGFLNRVEVFWVESTKHKFIILFLVHIYIASNSILLHIIYITSLTYLKTGILNLYLYLYFFLYLFRNIFFFGIVHQIEWNFKI